MNIASLRVASWSSKAHAPSAGLVGAGKGQGPVSQAQPSVLPGLFLTTAQPSNDFLRLLDGVLAEPAAQKNTDVDPANSGVHPQSRTGKQNRTPAAPPQKGTSGLIPRFTPAIQEVCRSLAISSGGVPAGERTPTLPAPVAAARAIETHTIDSETALPGTLALLSPAPSSFPTASAGTLAFAITISPQPSAREVEDKQSASLARGPAQTTESLADTHREAAAPTLPANATPEAIPSPVGSEERPVPTGGLEPAVTIEEPQEARIELFETPERAPETIGRPRPTKSDPGLAGSPLIAEPDERRASPIASVARPSQILAGAREQITGTVAVSAKDSSAVDQFLAPGRSVELPAAGHQDRSTAVASETSGAEISPADSEPSPKGSLFAPVCGEDVASQLLGRERPAGPPAPTLSTGKQSAAPAPGDSISGAGATARPAPKRVEGKQESAPLEKAERPAEGLSTVPRTSEEARVTNRVPSQDDPAEAGTVENAEPVEKASARAPASTARELSFRLQSEGAESINVQLRQRGTAVEIAVRSGNPQLAKALQGDLKELVGRLEDRGFETQAWIPTESRHGGVSSFASASGVNQEHTSGSGRQPQQDAERNQQNPRGPSRRPSEWAAAWNENLSEVKDL